jgi:cobalt-zinc-cadmium efflux system membrane fusion protein
MRTTVVGTLLSVAIVLAGCGGDLPVDPHPENSGADHSDNEPETGPHGGRLLLDEEDDGFALEIAIFESGVPPEFRLWASQDGVAVDPMQVAVRINLERLGGGQDEIVFEPQQDYLRGSAVVYEPHSFVVTIEASYLDRQHRWRYESFEGRTRIISDLAEAVGIETQLAGPATIRDYVTVYGRVVSNPENVSHVTARFDGVVESADAAIGDNVSRGQSLATVEADDSLNSYAVLAPISGTIIEKHANPGETTGGRTLFTIVDTSTVWAELAVFPSDRPRVRLGAPVALRTAIGSIESQGTIALLSPVAGENQSVTARVLLQNPDGILAAGMYLTAEIEIAQHEVPLAVKRSGLQPFRDFTVVFAQFGEEYEVRMLELGRQDDVWVEVLAGLEVGTPYVTANSYIIKADIEKSGASHDH